MGVLENGMPYLTQRGLAEMSGASRKALFDITQEYAEAQKTGVFTRSRMTYLRDNLLSKGYDEPQLFIEIEKNGSPYFGYPDLVCMAVTKYFVFEAQVKTRRPSLSLET